MLERALSGSPKYYRLLGVLLVLMGLGLAAYLLQLDRGLTIDQAIDHITAYGSHHTEAIVTENLDRAHRFLQEVQSSLVLVNASTRFNDGFQLGLGAEIGISTSRLHAFGPMGVEELTTTKFIALGNGQLRD